jgi:RNA recognition motif-containing protein
LIFILDLFHKFGRIKDVQVVIDKKTNKSRGFGFVYFDEIESATRVRIKQNLSIKISFFF